MDLSRDYAALSALRFMDDWSDAEVQQTITRLDAGEVVDICLHLLFQASLWSNSKR